MASSEALTDDIQQAAATFESIAMEAADSDVVPEVEAEGSQTPDIGELYPEGELSPDTILAAIEQDAAVEAADPEVPAEQQDVGEVPDPAEEKPAGKRAQQRIRNLVKQRNELQQQMEQMRLEQQQALAQMQQQQGSAVTEQIAELRRQNEFLTQQMLESRMAREEQELEPHEKWSRDLIRKQEKELGSHIERALAPYKNELEQLKAQQAQELQQRQMEMRLAKFSKQAEEARQNVLFNDLLSEDQGDLGLLGDEFILTNAAAFKQAPDEAAHEAKRFLDKYFKARLKAESTKRKKTMTKSKAAPTTKVSNRAAAKGQGMPKYTKAQVQKAGYDTYFDAAMQNFAGVTDD